MKKFTFMLIALLAAVVTFAAWSETQSASPFEYLSKSEIVKKQQPALKMKGIDRKAQPARNGVRRAPAELVTLPEGATAETYYTVGGSFSINTSSGWSDATSYMSSVSVAIDGKDMYIQGLAYWFEEAWIKGTIDGTTVTFPSGQFIGSDEYGDEFIVGSEDGETVADIVFEYDSEAGTLTAETAFILESGAADDLQPYCYWYKPVFSMTEPEAPGLVELPAGVETEEYAMIYTDYYDEEASTPVMIGFDGNDVYFQRFNSYLPEAWVKGTLDEGVVTLAGGQYFGAYGSYEMYLMEDDYQFAYDAEANTFTGDGLLYTYTGNQYADYYTNPVLKKVIEKAVMPANPEITDLKNGSYGWYFTFKVPVVDVNGDGLASSKLAYMIYTDIEGEITPLTFTPATHTRLTGNLTEIPYGFTESYDFYNTQIYLNELYSANWNNIGIQSIYYGGGETNATEVQWFHIKDYAKPAGGDVTFNFNTMDLATSSGVTTDGDITEALTITEGGVALTISPKTSGSSENRFWSTSAGPQLRVYSGTLTFEAPAGLNITQIVFNHNGKWGANTVEGVEIPNDAENKVATWTGEAEKVVVNIAANSQINSIVVTVKGEGGEDPVDPNAILYTFEDGTLQGWTTIDADGDGYTWKLGAAPSINTVNESNYSVYSESYSSDAGGALTPDNYLVSPQIKLDGSISFYACAQDGDWAAEHFAVAVSTKGNTDAADFTTVKEWTMTASRTGQPSAAPGKFRGPRKTPGAWYKYTVDLSSYQGADGYVAIRHFDCTDMFYIVVDDIALVTSHVTMPDFTISPAEGVVESLSDFTITFNNYEIKVGEDADATLKNTTNLDTYITSFDVEENKILISYEEVTVPGDYTLTVTGVSTAEGDPVELSFNYTIEAAPEVVVLPEGVEAETWYFTATAYQSSVRNQEVAVAIDGSDIYIQGLNVDYLPEAWVKGTIEGNTATFPTGQYFGAFEYNGTVYDMFFVGYDATTKEIADVVFTLDNEAGKMTTDQMIIINGKKDEISYYEYYYDVVILRELPVAPELVELPEGVEPEDWAIDGTFNDSYGSENVVRATEVAFDGNDIYVKGIPFYFEDAWMKGTINAETGIATFPTGQFVGEDDYGWEFMLGSDDYETLCDIEFAYDAEAKTLTQQTAYIIENGDTPDEISAYGYWTDMLIYAGEPIYEEPIEAPEGLVTEAYVFKANEIDIDDDSDLARMAQGDEEVATFDFNSLGTEEEPWPVSSGTGDNYDPAGEITEPLVLTEGGVTLTISPAEEGATPTRFWKTNNGPQLRVYNGKLTFEAPEGSKMTQIVFNAGKWNENNSADSGQFDGATWTGDAQSVVVTIGYYNEETGKWVSGNSQINSINVTVEGEGGDDPVNPEITRNYSTQMEVGFDGNDVYFKGVSDDTANMWLKGTLSEDGKTVTIPANQYMGEVSVLWFTYPYYFTAVAKDGETMEDIVLNWDAANYTFTTDQMLVLHDGKRSLGEPYQVFTDVEITKMEEFAATPADPSIDELSLTGSYPKAYFIIPTEDVDGNEILVSKLFYTVWIEKDGKEQPFTAVAGDYRYLTEDLTEIPYNYEDSYDIYRGGSVFYFNPTDVVTSWTKIGIQSIYYGGGECNKSNIVWEENPVYDPTLGIANVNADNQKAVIYDLQGRRIAQPAKGLYIVNGKKVVVK